MQGEPAVFQELNRRIRRCRKCRLWKGARNAVPGEGPAAARLMLIGQNPGEEEDRTGRPFVGRSGKYLDAALAAHGFARGDIFITGLVKHRSPKNRKPRTDEIRACTPYISEQIRIIQPDLVFLMGEVAWKTPRQEGIRYLETYHPAAAMRFPKTRRKFEKDLKKLKAFMEALNHEG
jgi:uracil-DNA glycosylase